MTILYSPSAHSNGGSGFYFSDDKNAPADSFPVASADQIAAINLPQGSTYSFAAPMSPALTGILMVTLPTQATLDAQAAALGLANFKALAQAALTESDKTILRCAENSVTVPATWATYRKALRSALSSTVAGTLPTQPSYPAGT